MIKKYRKIPTIIIEAIQYNGYNDWCWNFPDIETTLIINEDKSFYIKTLEGDMKCSLGDYIVRGIDGEYYPVKKEIFEKTYELIE